MKYITELSKANVDKLNIQQKNLCLIMFNLVDYIYRKHDANYAPIENDETYQAWLDSPMASTVSTPIVNEAECRDFLRQFDKNFDTYSRSLVFQNLSGFTGGLSRNPGSYVRNSSELQIFNFHQYINDLMVNGRLKSVEELDKINIDANNALVTFQETVNKCVEHDAPSI